jgi:hypothetical protein
MHDTFNFLIARSGKDIVHSVNGRWCIADRTMHEGVASMEGSSQLFHGHDVTRDEFDWLSGESHGAIPASHTGADGDPRPLKAFHDPATQEPGRTGDQYFPH